MNFFCHRGVVSWRKPELSEGWLDSPVSPGRGMISDSRPRGYRQADAVYGDHVVRAVCARVDTPVYDIMVYEGPGIHRQIVGMNEPRADLM